MIIPRLIFQSRDYDHSTNWLPRGEGIPGNTSLIYVIVGFDIMQGQKDANIPVGINGSRFFQE